LRQRNALGCGNYYHYFYLGERLRIGLTSSGVLQVGFPGHCGDGAANGTRPARKEVTGRNSHGAKSGRGKAPAGTTDFSKSP